MCSGESRHIPSVPYSIKCKSSTESFIPKRWNPQGHQHSARARTLKWKAEIVSKHNPKGYNSIQYIACYVIESLESQDSAVKCNSVKFTCKWFKTNVIRALLSFVRFCLICSLWSKGLHLTACYPGLDLHSRRMIQTLEPEIDTSWRFLCTTLSWMKHKFIEGFPSKCWTCKV